MNLNLNWIEFTAVFSVMFLLHTFGITFGYHRLLSHRSFKCIKPLEYFFVLCGYLAFEGSPIWWATIHRAHHRHHDTPLDPHSPRNGILYAHFGWLGEKRYPDHIDPITQSQDLIKDPIYRLLDGGDDLRRGHHISFATGFAFRALLWAVFGWQVALASLLAGLLVMQTPLWLNVVCHLRQFGYRSFATTDDSVNCWWVAALTMGEGWHNNHHAFPGSPRMGARWFEVDPTWMLIAACKKLGWVTVANVPEKLMSGRACKGSSVKDDRGLVIAQNIAAAAAELKKPALSGSR
ncbi:acyl-CoA desaturase [bacterium]|nr:acyl-CoA desaturase [bacterium]QQR56224.1 MAG: acyl-CoA desaturase [Candidatus Melainabacteria bacterium]